MRISHKDFSKRVLVNIYSSCGAYVDDETKKFVLFITYKGTNYEKDYQAHFRSLASLMQFCTHISNGRARTCFLNFCSGFLLHSAFIRIK